MRGVLYGYWRDYQEMMEQECPDIVSVVTSDHLHAGITVNAIRELIRRGAVDRLCNGVCNLYGPLIMRFRNGNHPIDMIRFFAEPDPDRIFAWL